MEKNTILAFVLSIAFLLFWWTVVAPPQKQPVASAPAAVAREHTTPQQTPVVTPQPSAEASPVAMAPEKEIIIDAPAYRAVFSSRGAAIKHWFIKEKNESVVDLVMNEAFPPMATLAPLSYTIASLSERSVTFRAKTPAGYTVEKTYALSDEFLHTVSFTVTPPAKVSQPLLLDFGWGPGLGTDVHGQKENLRSTRIIGLPLSKEKSLQKFKPGEFPAADYQWAGIDNQYFLAAVIPSAEAGITNISVRKSDKKAYPAVLFSRAIEPGNQPVSFSFSLFIGPKDYTSLSAMGLRLERAVDFGTFGFLGKIALGSLNFLNSYTHNYGWAIVVLTLLLQIIVFPLTVKSFKAQADMKRLQPVIKELQERYKEDPKRLNVEMLNIYKNHKVNPLGGCLPMLLQLPIFWALFTTLRNAYELRGAPWLLWITDLSARDPYYVLPVVMGVGMLLQQKLAASTIDPAQARMMMMMPIVFTFMFLNFPAGLVLYWLTNSIVSIVQQYVIMNKKQ